MIDDYAGGVVVVVGDIVGTPVAVPDGIAVRQGLSISATLHGSPSS